MEGTATSKITNNAGMFICKGELNVLSLIERISFPPTNLLDISKACEKERYTQKTFVGVIESLFGISSTKITTEEYSNSGKPFYFFKFKNLLIWCHLRTDNYGRNEYLAAINIEDEEIIELNDDSSLLRIKGDGCILYLEASMSELKKWRKWR